MEKNVLITGGSRGIGKAIADEFRKAGYVVYAPSRKELDLSDNFSVCRYLEENKNVYFSSIINNAGINIVNKIEDVQKSVLEDTIMVNLVSTINIIKSFVPNMKKIILEE